jgi:hypothetical protein
MIKYCFFALSIFFFISCNNRQKSQKYVSSSDSLALAIQGIWGGDEPTFDIGIDSIFYYSEKKSYYYFIHGNDMIVLYKNGPYSLKNIQIEKDTFFCERHNQLKLQMYRFKNNKPIKQNYGYSKNEIQHEISYNIAEVKKGILGEWGYKHSKGVFSWIITEDSIEYIQKNKKFYFQQNNNNIIVLTDEEPVIMKDVLIKGDTMYFTTQDSILIKAHKMH